MEDELMPLKDLPDYIRSVRKNGQDDHVPVVEMGVIVAADKPSGFRFAALTAMACLILAVCGALGYDAASKEIVLTASEGMDSAAVADMISGGGARVVSVRKSGEETYEVRVLTLRNLASLLDSLRKNKEFKKVEAK